MGCAPQPRCEIAQQFESSTCCTGVLLKEEDTFNLITFFPYYWLFYLTIVVLSNRFLRFSIRRDHKGGFGDWLDDSTYDGATLPLGIPDWSLPNEEEVVNDIGNNSSNSTTSSAYNSYKDDGMMKRRQLLGLPSLSSDNADSLSSNMVRGAALFDFGPHSHYHQGGQGEGWLGAHSGRPDGSRCGSCDVVQGAWVSGLDATTSSRGEKKSSCLYDGLGPTCASSYCGLDG